MRIVFTLFAFLLALPATPALAQRKPAKAPVKRSYVRRDLGLAFNRPAQWTEGASLPDDSPLSGNLVIGFERRGDDVFQGTVIFLGTIKVIVLNEPKAGLPPNFTEALDAEYKKRIPAYSLSGTAKFKVAGEPATSIAYQARDQRMGVIGRVRQVWVLHNKRLWLFTLTAKIEEFDRYVEDFDKMMASIQWLPTK